MTRVVILSVWVVAVVCCGGVAAHPGDGVIVTANGDIYFGSIAPISGREDHHFGALWRWTKDGGAKLVYRSRHNASNLLLTLGLDGNIYFKEKRYLGEEHGPDAFETFVRKLVPDGEPETVFGPILGRAGDAAYVVDADGTVFFVSDRTIRKRAADGVETVFAGGEKGHRDGRGAEARFTLPHMLAWGPGGLYVADGDAVRVVDGDGNVTTLVKELKSHEPERKLSDHWWIFGMSVNPKGDVFLADWGNRRVLRVSASEKVSTVLKTEEPWTPEGVAATADRLVVLESTGPMEPQILPRLRALEKTGKVVTLFEHSER